GRASDGVGPRCPGEVAISAMAPPPRGASPDLRIPRIWLEYVLACDLPGARRMGDADITLRHVTRRRAEELARAFVAEDHPITVVGWVDSQVTKIERRLDKAMRLRVGGEPRVLHVELYLTMTSEVPDKILDYL